MRLSPTWWLAPFAFCVATIALFAVFAELDLAARAQSDDPAPLDYEITGTGTRNPDGTITLALTLTELPPPPPPAPTEIRVAWQETGPANSLVTADTFEALSTEIVSRGSGPNCHAHTDVSFSAPTELYAEVFVVTTAAGTGCGITLLSDYPSSDTYLRVRTYGGAAWDANLHPDAQIVESPALPKPSAGEWWSIRVRVPESGAVSLRAWQAGDSEPDTWSTAPYSGPRSGRVGLWYHAAQDFRWRGLRVGSIDDTSLPLSWDSEISVTPTPPDDPPSDPNNPIPPPSPTPTDPPIVDEPPPASVQVIDQFGARWHLASSASSGRFVTGDPWVIGPVTVAAVELLDSPQSSPGGGRHGSEINPHAGFNPKQSLDSRAPGYDSTRTVSFPVELIPGDSLVTSTSWIDGESGFPRVDSRGPRPALKRVSVLTCLATAPSADAFRPPYVGGSVAYWSSEIDLAALPALAAPASTPDPSSVIASRSAVQYDPIGSWSGRYIHPSRNLPNYGADIATAWGDVMLLACTDAVTDAERRALAVIVCQLAIDIEGILAKSVEAQWPAAGGHASGRLAPLAFAARVMSRPHFAELVRSSPGDFGETTHTYFGQGGRALFGRECNGKGYVNHDCRDPNGLINDPTLPGNGGVLYEAGGYRLCCTANAWIAHALLVELLSVDVGWPAWLAYTDAYWAEISALPATEPYRDFWRAKSSFTRAMWEAHR